MESIRPAATCCKFRRVIKRIPGGVQTSFDAGSGGRACTEADRFHIQNGGRDSGGGAGVDFLVSERESVRAVQAVTLANVAQILGQPGGWNFAGCHSERGRAADRCAAGENSAGVATGEGREFFELRPY